MGPGRIGSQRRKASSRSVALYVMTAASALLVGCGVRGGAPPGSPGHVSDANEACATLFCSAEAQSDSDPRCAPSCKCGRYDFSEPEYDQHGQWQQQQGGYEPGITHLPARNVPDGTSRTRSRRSGDAPGSLRGLLLVSGPRHVHRAKRPQPRWAPLRHARHVRGQDAIHLPQDTRLHRCLRPDLELQHRKHARKVHGNLYRDAPHQAQAARRELERLPRLR